MKVIALETGFDNVALRNPGEIFDMPDDVFERRPYLNAVGEPIKDKWYEPPHWFEPVDASLKVKVDGDRKNIRRTAGVPAIDPTRQQADQQAEGRLRSSADAQVRQELIAEDEAEINRRVEARLAELRKDSGLKVPKEDKPEPLKGTPPPSPETVDRTLHTKPTHK